MNRFKLALLFATALAAPALAQTSTPTYVSVNLSTDPAGPNAAVRRSYLDGKLAISLPAGSAALYGTTGTAGVAAPITVGTGLSLSGGVLTATATGGGTGILTSFQGRATPAAVLTAADVTGVGGALASALAPVATAGTYASLTGQPTIPTNNNQLTNGSGFQTAANVNAALASAIPAGTGLYIGTGTAGQLTALTLGTNLSISGTTLNATAGGAGLSSFQGRTTAAAVLTAADVTGVGGALASSLAPVATAGTYSSLTGLPATFPPPVATASVLGGVKAGSGVAIAADGTISASGTSGLASFQGRTASAATLLSADVTGALGFTPAPTANAIFTGSHTLPTTTTAGRPASPTVGMVAYNSDTQRYEFYTGGAGWVNHVRTSGDTVSGTLTATSFVGPLTGNATNVTGVVAVANGGTGTTTPGIVAGTNVTVTGTWPNQTVNAATGGAVSYVETEYTASGAIAPTDDVALCNYAANGTMTLANGSIAGKELTVKRYGAGTVTVNVASLDGSANGSVVLQSSLVKEAVTFKWSSIKTTWLLK